MDLSKRVVGQPFVYECAMRSKTGVRRPRQVFGFTPNPAWRLLRQIIDLPDPGPHVGERLGLYFK
jgi:hypothetical protein